jgi:hypothetical protein
LSKLLLLFTSGALHAILQKKTKKKKTGQRETRRNFLMMIQLIKEVIEIDQKNRQEMEIDSSS